MRVIHAIKVLKPMSYHLNHTHKMEFDESDYGHDDRLHILYKVKFCMIHCIFSVTHIQTHNVSKYLHSNFFFKLKKKKTKKQHNPTQNPTSYEKKTKHTTKKKNKKKTTKRVNTALSSIAYEIRNIKTHCTLSGRSPSSSLTLFVVTLNVTSLPILNEVPVYALANLS